MANGRINDFYRQFEKLNENLDKANNTISKMSFEMSCLRAELKESIEQNKKDKETIQKLLLEIERLKNNNNKNSSNSSKPSSTNGFKKVMNNRTKSNRKQGGQLNHPGKTLTKDYVDNLIKNNEIDEIKEVIENKNEFNEHLTPIVTYELDIKISKVLIKHITYPNKQTNINNSPVYYGNNIKCLSNLLSMKYMSIDGIKEVISDITNNTINLSKGTINTWNKSISNKLRESEYEFIKKELLNSLILHVDESPIKINGEQFYVHNISNGKYTLQYTNKKRGTNAIEEFGFLREFQGILIHDHFSMYYNYGIDNAECNVHIIRYLKGVDEFTEHTWAKEMIALLLNSKERKEILLSNNIETMSKEEYLKYETKYLELIKLGRSEYKKDYKTNAYKEEEIKLLNRMEKYVHNHLLFLKKFYIPFSNNRAEADLRYIKVKQKIGKFKTEESSSDYIISRSCYSTYHKNDISYFKAIKAVLNNEPIII